MANAGPDTNKAQVRQLPISLIELRLVLYNVCETDEFRWKILDIWKVSFRTHRK
jgi:hypothetical protein